MLKSIVTIDEKVFHWSENFHPVYHNNVE